MPTDFMNVITALRDAGIGIAALGILLYYMRSRGSADAKTSDQFKQVIVMLADSLKREDSDTAKALSMVKSSLDQNTAAFLQDSKHSAELVSATKELTALQAANNAEVAALRGELTRIPDTIERMDTKLDRVDIGILNVVNGFGSLGEGMRSIEKSVEKNPVDLQTVVDVQNKILECAQTIFKLIDTRLPASAKTITPPLATHPPDTLGYDLLREAKRKFETDQMPKAPPDDTGDAA